MNFPLFDAHCHLGVTDFDCDRTAVIERAKEAGVIGIVAVCEGANDWEVMKTALVPFRGYAHPCIGLHPCNVSSLNDVLPVTELIREHSAELVGIGECGLDFSPHVLGADPALAAARKDAQLAVFQRHISIATELELPLNVHSRSAGHHALETLAAGGARDVLMHAFDGRPAYIRRGVELGYYFSVPPSTVRNPQQRAFVEAIPLSNMLLESDAPALPAVKGARNEPCEVATSCRLVAQIKGVTPEEVAAATTANARRLFPKAFLMPCLKHE